MTRDNLIDLLTGDFYDNFANTMSALVIKNGMVDELYSLALGECSLPKVKREKLLFRAAYTLEAIFFNHKEYFNPYKNRFFCDFVRCTNNSAKRHFTKMIAHLLSEFTPDNCEEIAEKCAEWAVDRKLRVAARMGAVEVLFLLREKVEWIDDIIGEIVELMELTSCPSVECRIKRWRNVRAV